MQMGYNLLYGLWKYSWDADCELFLKIMQDEMKEDVYLQQIQLQVHADLHVTYHLLVNFSNDPFHPQRCTLAAAFVA